MEKIKEFMADHLTDLIAISAGVYFVLGCWLLYTANRTASDYHHVHDTVQSIESDNREARQQIGNASKQIEHAQKQLDQSVKRVDRITERTQQVKSRVDDNSRIVRECQDIVDAGRRDTEEARNIFRDVEAGNKADGTQTSRT